jgi:hypothetical protein
MVLSGNYGSKLLFFIALNALAPLNHNHRLNLNLNYKIPCKSALVEVLRDIGLNKLKFKQLNDLM